MSYTDILETSQNYLERLKNRSASFEIKCSCSKCNWTEIYDVTDIHYSSFNDMQAQMSCPQCTKYGLSISVVVKQKFLMTQLQKIYFYT